MKAYTSDRFVLPLPPGHRFPMSKYALLRERVEALSPHIRLTEAPQAIEDELLLAHSPRYVTAVLQGLLSAAELREIGFPWSPWMAERARRSVGASIAAARSALAEGVAANLAGGTHHASADKGSGFCVFNDVAVAARLMQAEWRRTHRQLLHVLVVDLDVHQGNGTADIFSEDDTVFTFSMHGARNFPFRKVPSSLDVDLDDGCDDAHYLAALEGALAKIDERLAGAPPSLAFYLAGADPHESDRLGRLKLSAEGLAQRDRRVLSWLRERRIPVALSMAGGYGHDIATTVSLQHRTLELAAEAWTQWRGA
ncbi:histone deacetylase [Ideonella sp.]|uniref:histone deacetylase n=1 Tax=Ideonella sp. TaxID=1929293 RepID=UPI0037BF644A